MQYVCQQIRVDREGRGGRTIAAGSEEWSDYRLMLGEMVVFFCIEHFHQTIYIFSLICRP